MAEHPFQVRPQQEVHSGRAAAVHLALDDATGDSAIIEYVGGAPRVRLCGDDQLAALRRANWRTLADLTSGVYAFESSYRPDIVWVHLNRVDFDHCHRLDLSADDLVGDVTDALVPATPFAFASAH